VFELLEGFSEFVTNEEPDVLMYQMLRGVNTVGGAEEIIALELYKSREAMEAHRDCKEHLDLLKTMEDESLLDGPIQAKFIKEMSGFSTRS